MHAHLTPAKPALSTVLMALLRRPHRDSQPTDAESGLTLIECLMAIIVISVTVVAIAPPIMMATATRIQARRIEIANQVAQGEIDRVRSLVERGSYTMDALPVDAGTDAIDTVAVASGAPTGSMLSPANCTTTAARYPTATPVALTSLVRVDINGDCAPEYVMQIFRTTGKKNTTVATDPPVAFQMGVRVYAYYPGTDDNTFPTLSKERASAVLGNNRRDQADTRRPMAVLYSSIARNDSPEALCQIGKQSAAAGVTPAACD